MTQTSVGEFITRNGKRFNSSYKATTRYAHLTAKAEQASALAMEKMLFKEASQAETDQYKSEKPEIIRLFKGCLAETVGFEPTCPVEDNAISSRARYDCFDTSPFIFFTAKIILS